MCSFFPPLCSCQALAHQREDSARGCCMVHRDHTGFRPNGETFPSVQQHVAPACSVSLEIEGHRWWWWEHKALQSSTVSEVVQLHQMPLASEPKHIWNFSLVFHQLLVKHRGVFGGCTAEDNNKPTFCLPKNTVGLFPRVQRSKHVAQRLRLTQLPVN